MPGWLEPYLPIAVIAALDAVFGGIRARLDGIFDAKVFVVSFVSNMLVASLIVFVGDKLGVGGQLSTAVVVVSSASASSATPPPSAGTCSTHDTPRNRSPYDAPRFCRDPET